MTTSSEPNSAAATKRVGVASDTATIRRFQGALSEALTPITQLFLHAAILKARSHPLATRCHREWVGTMKRSDRLLEAILESGGRPASRRATPVALGRTPARIFELDIACIEAWIGTLEGTLSHVSDAAASSLGEVIDGERSALAWRRAERERLDAATEGASQPPAIDPSLAGALDTILRRELSAITQIYYHGLLCEAWGAEEPAAFLAQETWEKTWRSVDLADALLSVGAVPSEEGHGELRIGRDVAEILDHDGAWLDTQLAALDDALARCDASQHPEVHALLQRMRDGERRHAEWIRVRRH